MANFNYTDETIDSLVNTTSGIPARPTQRLSGISERFLNIQRYQKLNTTIPIQNSTGTNIPKGAPKQIVSVTATESPVKVGNRMFSLVGISFIKDPADTNFASVRIWFKGYQGNTNYQLMPNGNSSDSPISIIVETTGETVVVAVQAISADGTPADLSGCPIATVLLDGVISAPPAPSVTQTCLPIFGGIQFGFTELSGLAADVIQAYKIYRNTSNNSGTATVIQTIPHDPKNAGTTVVVQDNQIIANVFYWYWVSAVNTTGLESTLTVAGNSAGNFGSPTETVNLLSTPDLSGSGSLPVFTNANFTWQYLQVGGSPSVPEYRNGREIRIPFSTSGSATVYCAAVQSLERLRFKAGQAITVASRVRKDNGVGSPTGAFVIAVQPVSNAGVLIGTSTIINSVNLANIPQDNTLYRGTQLLNTIGGQDGWAIVFYNTSSNCDIYITEPMMNTGFDASPFTTNMFTSTVTQYQYEGLVFVSDDFTDTNGTAFGLTSSAHLPTASGGASGSGIGEQWAEVLIAGTDKATIQSGKAQYQYSNTGVLGDYLIINRYPTENPNSNIEIGHIVQADCVAGSGTGGGATSAAGVVGKLIDSVTARTASDQFPASGAFYVAQLETGGNVGLYKTTNNGGTYTLLGSFASGLSSATIKLVVTSATKQVFVNGTQRISSTDNAVVYSTVTAGSFGDFYVGARLSANYTSITTKPSVDNFTAIYCQNVASPPTPPAPGSGGSSAPGAPPPQISYDPSREPSRDKTDLP